MPKRTAHVLDEKWRSDDIRIVEDVDFSSLLLPEKLLKGLKSSGFKYPSPIQLKAIPAGRAGNDLIVQAKSGTGKTIVFTVVAFNMLMKNANHAQVLILAPTREIACQICEVIKTVGCLYKDVACEYFIGGRRLEEDIPRIQGCQVVVGTPGRIKQLINYNILKTAAIRLFVLDEADQLLKESSFSTDIDDIFRALPRDKQMIATSATYPNKLKSLTKKYFREPLHIRLNINDIGLLGMVHYYCEIPVSQMPVVAYREKLKAVKNVLLNVKFGQALVFCNMVSRVGNLCNDIMKFGFATDYISSQRSQEERLNAIRSLQKFHIKILVSSDVTSRGIDSEHVDLVINFDLPSYLDVYFHRVGRGGRYGSRCASVSFITNDEIEVYRRMQLDGNFKSYKLPDPVPKGLINMVHKKKSITKEKHLSSDGESNSSSNTSSDTEEPNGNKMEQKNAKGFVEDFKMNVDKDSHTSKVAELISENLANSSDEKLVDSDVASIGSGDSHRMRNGLLDLNSNPTISVNDDLCSASESVESDNSNSLELKQQVDIEICSSTENESTDKENDKEMKVNENFEESYENKLEVEVLNRENSEMSLVDNIKIEKLPSNTRELQQIEDTNSCLEDTESVSENLLKKKTVDEKSLVLNNKCHASKILSNPDLKEFISSAVALVKEFENCKKGSDESSTAESTKASEAVNVDEPNSNTFSSTSLKYLRSDLKKYRFIVSKAFLENLPEGLLNEIVPGSGKEKSVNQIADNEERYCVKENDDQNQIQDSCQDLGQVLFSTPRTEVLTASKSDHSSGHESNVGSDKEKLMKHFNALGGTIHKEKSFFNKNFSSENEASILLNGEDAMYKLTKEFNKVTMEKRMGNKEANIINNTELSSSADSDSGTSIDSDKVDEELEKEFAKLMRDKRSDGGSNKDTEETKKILQKIKGANKCFKSIEIVDTKKHTESSSTDSDNSIDSINRKANKSMQNKRNEIGGYQMKTHKKGHKLKAKTIVGPGQNKITRYYSGSSSSESESDFDQHSKESHSSLKAEHQRKIHKKSKLKSKTITGPGQNKITRYYSESSSSETESNSNQHSKESHSSLKAEHQRKIHKKSKLKSKTITGPGQNKITRYYSESSSSESESDNDQHSKQSHSILKAEIQRKTCKKDEKIPKAESLFNYSNADGTHFNATHSTSHMQQTDYASNSFNQQSPEQNPSYANHGLFSGTQSTQQLEPPSYASDSCYQSYSQPMQSHANHEQYLNGQYSNQMASGYNYNSYYYPYFQQNQGYENHGLYGQSNHQMQPMGCNSNPHYYQQNQGHENCRPFSGTYSTQVMDPTGYVFNSYYQYPSECALKESCQMNKIQPARSRHSGCSCNCQKNSNPSMNHVQPNYPIQPTPYGYNHCFVPTQHPCHLPNESCQSPTCAAWYDMFYKQWQFLNRHSSPQ